MEKTKRERTNIYQVVTADELEDLIFEGTGKEVSEEFGVSETTVMRASIEGRLFLNEFNVKNINNPKEVKYKKIPIYFLVEDDEMEYIVFMGRIEEIEKFTGLKRTSLYSALKRRTKIDKKLMLYKLEETEDEIE